MDLRHVSTQRLSLGAKPGSRAGWVARGEDNQKGGGSDMASANKDWERDIYQKAKSVAVEIISQAGRPVPFAEICEQMKSRYPELCDDSIPDPWAPSQPYWNTLRLTNPVKH